MDTHRGPREFQYDSVFMPDSTQEKVFEDTSVSDYNNHLIPFLVTLAHVGYVCHESQEVLLSRELPLYHNICDSAKGKSATER